MERKKAKKTQPNPSIDQSESWFWSRNDGMDSLIDPGIKLGVISSIIQKCNS